MNPYATFLGDRDPLAVIETTPARLEHLVQTLGTDDRERAPAPGKWSVREILCHLADCEIAFGFRLRQALAEEHHVIQPFDQEQWARRYAGYDAHTALAVYASLRKWNVALLAQVKPEEFSKALSHPERGEMTFRSIVETMGGHDLNHLRQVEGIAAAAATA